MLELFVEKLELDEVKDAIINNYDFDEIILVMDVLDWKYFYGSPTRDDLVESVSRLLDLLFDEDCDAFEETVMTGGFVIRKYSYGVEIFFRVQPERVYLRLIK